MNIAIVGSGIIGLTTAHELLRAGHHVRVFTKDARSEITSSKAAAIWFPYLARPVEAVNRWSRESYGRYLTELGRPETGISLVDLTVLVQDPDAWWRDAIPPGTLRPLPPEDLPEGSASGYLVQVPLIETQLYLAALEAEVGRLGGTIAHRAVGDLAELSGDHDLVVNCSGLGARELVGDTTMYPVKGQILKLKNRPDVRHVIADYSFDAAGEQAAYLIPRRDFLIMGGTSIKGDWDTTPDPALTAGILERCRRITKADLDDMEVDEVVVGLRPGRPEIRVERVGNIIHNYGHGGAGYTVCWGCAKRVVELVGTELWEATFQDEQTLWSFEPAGSAVTTAALFEQLELETVLIPGLDYGRNARPFLDAGLTVSEHLGDKTPVHHGSVSDMPFDTERYDGVFCYALLHLLDAPARAKLIADCYRQLRPGGYSVFVALSTEDGAFGQGEELKSHRFRSAHGVELFFYDEEAVATEFGAFGLIDAEVIEEPGRNREGAAPRRFWSITCQRETEEG